MATLQAATTSSSAGVTDPPAVRDLCQNHSFGTLHWKVEDGEFSIWGYDTFDVYATQDNGDPDHEAGIVTSEFLHSLVEYIKPGDELDIQTAGFTKCRHPVLASRYVLRDGQVLWATLDSLSPLDESRP
jgi:hypothetical protein